MNMILTIIGWYMALSIPIHLLRASHGLIDGAMDWKPKYGNRLNWTNPIERRKYKAKQYAYMKTELKIAGIKLLVLLGILIYFIPEEIFM